MRILVADKDSHLRTAISTHLKNLEYEVIEASESEDVLRQLDRNPVDLMLIATVMEPVNERLLVDRIRSKPHLMAIPIILMTEEETVNELLMYHDIGFDDFMVKPFDPIVLELRVTLNIERSRHRVEANALTHLPGNYAIERMIRNKIEKDEKFSVLYVDINHFKSFNDRCGFEKGDDAIRQTAKMLLQTRDNICREGECFVGHIGGDDFVVVLSPEHEESYARAFIAEFDRIMPTYYNDEDQSRGFVRVVNRQGKRENVPLMSCSVAACNNLYRSYKNLGEIAQEVAEVKAFLKTQPGSHYLRDRRSAPLKDLHEAVGVLAAEIPNSKEKKHAEYPLGQVLLNAGLITQEQLDLALKRHLETGQRLGQILIQMDAVKSSDVGRMLQKKLNVHYVNLHELKTPRSIVRLFTIEFMKSHRILPLGTMKGAVKLGMCDPFDVKLIDSIEKVTGLRISPYLILEGEFEDFIEKLGNQPA